MDTNASIFSKRLAAVRKVCQGECEMVFVDAPLVIDVPDATGDDLNKYDSAAAATHTPGQMILKKPRSHLSEDVVFPAWHTKVI